MAPLMLWSSQLDCGVLALRSDILEKLACAISSVVLSSCGHTSERRIHAIMAWHCEPLLSPLD